MSHLTSTLPSDPSAPPGTIDMIEAKGKVGTESNLGGRHHRWLEEKMFAGARAAVWTETEAGVHTKASGKVFTETGIMTGTDIWAEVGAEWRPGDTEPSVPREPAAWPEHQGLQAHGMSQRDQPALSSVSSILAETVAPILAKPLGLLSKAAWTRSFSSSLSKISSPTTKASPSRPSSSPSPAVNRETQTVAPSNSSLVYVNSNSSDSNSSSHWGKKPDFPACT